MNSSYIDYPIFLLSPQHLGLIQENVDKISRGIPLQDEDREYWLQILASNIKSWNADNWAVLACSALKEKYRKKLLGDPHQAITWIFLNSEYERSYSNTKPPGEHMLNY